MIETERMWLMPVSLDHLHHYVELDADPEVKRFIDGGKPPVEAEIAAEIELAIGHRWTGLDKADGHFLGWFGAWPSDIRSRELGYRLLRSAWGEGLATEGARAVIDHTFDDRAVELIWAQTMTVNIGSRRVMEKCGLRFVHTFFGEWEDEIAGSDQGDVRYELDRATWQRSRGA